MTALYNQSSGIPFDRYETDDGVTFVVDLGPGVDASVEILDGTALVVLEDGPESGQREFDLPEGDAQAFINNGVLTIEVSQ